jgi:hypothetical protein
VTRSSLDYQGALGAITSCTSFPCPVYRFTVPANILASNRCIHAHVAFQQTSISTTYEWMVGTTVIAPTTGAYVVPGASPVIAFQDIDVCENPSGGQQVTLTPAIGSSVASMSSVVATTSLSTNATFLLSFELASLPASNSVTPEEFKVNF